MLYSLGSLTIKIAPFNVHEVQRDAETEYAQKPILGAEPTLEFVGEGANTWQLSGRLLPEKLGGLAELDILHQMRISGLPQYLMRGDGKPLGWVVIESVSEKSSYLGSNGVGQIIEVSISLRRSRKPENSSFFSIISGLFS